MLQDLVTNVLQPIIEWLVRAAGVPSRYRTALISTILALLVWIVTVVVPTIFLVKRLVWVLVLFTVIAIINPDAPVWLAGIVSTLMVTLYTQFPIGGKDGFL